MQNFRSADSTAFEVLMRHLGFKAAACYRQSGDSLVQIMRMDTGDEWPVSVELALDYTSPEAALVPLGWTAPAKVEDAPAGWRNLWPKGTTLYFPEQELFKERFLFAMVQADGKRVKPGELSGSLEVVAGRLRSWFEEQTVRMALSEAGLKEHIRALGVDLSRIIEHELRTPLASIAGYGTLLKDLDPHSQRAEWDEYRLIMDTETQNALEAVDKLSLALHAGGTHMRADEPEDFDGAKAVQELCDEARRRASDVLGAEAAKRLVVRFLKSTDQSCRVVGSERLFRSAVWEVVKNAMSHTRTGRVDVGVYASGANLVIDVVDDGVGVSPGAEELIFLRFYQDPAAQQARRGKRGLGLGLFLARHIAERHLGQLALVRQKGGTTFRFLWPRALGQALAQGA